MKQTFDTDSILYELLNVPKFKGVLKGGIYFGDDRPDDSENEDVLIESTNLTQEYLPQVGTSVLFIYVPDIKVKINGKEQFKSNRNRLEILSKTATDILRNARLDGMKLIIGSQVILSEPTINQHFIAIRISWNIQII